MMRQKYRYQDTGETAPIGQGNIPNRANGLRKAKRQMLFIQAQTTALSTYMLNISRMTSASSTDKANDIWH